MASKAFALTAARVQTEAKGNQARQHGHLDLKNAGTRVGQDRAELTLEILGAQGLGWEGDAFSSEEKGVVRQWLYGKAYTIYGGSAEVQNNIISKRILGLPDPLSAN